MDPGTGIDDSKDPDNTDMEVSHRRCLPSKVVKSSLLISTCSNIRTFTLSELSLDGDGVADG
jgi:hypothetical protein